MTGSIQETKALVQFSDFYDRLHDFSWLLDWAAIGQPYYHLYVVGPSDAGPVKIGISNKCIRRLASIQTGNWNKLFVLRSFWVPSFKDAIKIERHTHKALRKNHLVGEWFSLGADDALEVAEWSADHHGIARRADIPDEHTDLIFSEIRDRLEDHMVLDKDLLETVRTAALARYGVREISPG